jgi:hypothetical protein
MKAQLVYFGFGNAVLSHRWVQSAGFRVRLWTANCHGRNASGQSTTGNHVRGCTEHTRRFVPLGNGEIDSRPDSATSPSLKQMMVNMNELAGSGHRSPITDHREIEFYGRGGGEPRGVALGPGLGRGGGVTLGVAVGVTVGVGVAVGVGVGVGDGSPPFVV